MIVRPTSAEDAEDVSAILRASYGRLLREAYSASVLERLLPVLARANPTLLASGAYFIALDADGRGAGCGGWSFERPETAHRSEGLGHIRHFATDPDLTGRGVGRALFDACSDQARAAGVREFEAYATLNAEGFYAALGFVRVGRIDVQIADAAFPSLRMRRRMDAP